MTDPTEAVSAAMEAELSLLDPAVRLSPKRLAGLLHPDDREFGTSGRIWDRDSMNDIVPPPRYSSRGRASDAGSTGGLDGRVGYRSSSPI